METNEDVNLQVTNLVDPQNNTVTLQGNKIRTLIQNVWGSEIVVDVFQCGSVALFYEALDMQPFYFVNPQQTNEARDILHSLDFDYFDLAYPNIKSLVA